MYSKCVFAFSEKFVDGKTYTNGISNGNGVSHFKKKPEFKTAEDCKSALEKAVIRRCMADVEIGLLLSGGLDSSILGALMIQPHIKKHLTGNINFMYTLNVNTKDHQQHESFDSGGSNSKVREILETF